MFTGIITDIGIVTDVDTTDTGVRLVIRSPKTARRLRRGGSVAIDGVCTTVEQIRNPQSAIRNAHSHQTFTVRLMPVTLKLTTLGSLKPGHRVNLEPSLRVGDAVGGHFILGHVDGVGSITRIAHSGSRIPRVTSYELRVTIPSSLKSFIVPRGSIAVDGVSLTVVARRANVCTVSLVDYTIKHTTLGEKKVGDRVNIEIDSLARYAHR